MPRTTKSPSAVAAVSLPATAQTALHFTPAFQSAMHELLKAYELAVHSDYDPWELAVEIRGLKALGVTETDLRWLVRSGYITHAREVTDLDEDGREFRPTGNLSFAKRTCFVLTAAGESFARVLFNGGIHGADATSIRLPPGNGAGNGNGAGRRPASEDDSCVGTRHPTEQTNDDGNGKAGPLVPHWDAQRHELRVGGQLVKRFKCAAVNQETILAAFAEEGWPPRIDDPLPPQEEQDSKRRLNDTIKCLNKNQKHKLICFHGDGTGEGVLWTLAECDEG